MATAPSTLPYGAHVGIAIARPAHRYLARFVCGFTPSGQHGEVSRTPCTETPSG